ncbi:MAG: type IV toxin-antitoxin system AbiEi family antitoxin domain-containing protein [Candidatus Sericytochromatia bacterium]
MLSETKLQQVLALLEHQPLLRPRDLKRAGLPPEYLSYLYHQQRLAKIGRGLYALPDQAVDEHYSQLEVAKRVPDGVLCLLSALEFHGLTTQNPFDIWLALPAGRRSPKLENLSVRFFHFAPEAYRSGIETHTIQSIDLKVYSVSKTIVDCFKFRNQIGLDVALEALKEAMSKKRFSQDELWKYARICRMTTVMRPYLEALL